MIMVSYRFWGSPIIDIGAFPHYANLIFNIRSIARSIALDNRAELLNHIYALYYTALI